MYLQILLFLTIAYSTNSDQECGITTVNHIDIANCSMANQEIVGGQSTKITEWPWQVLLYVIGKYVCGGTIIDTSYILTAAHCTYNISIKEIVVYSGISHSGYIFSKLHRLNVTEISIPDTYDRNTLTNDISLLKLQKPLVYSSKIRPICLPTVNLTNGLLDGTDFYATGFGLTQADTPFRTMRLQVVCLPYIKKNCLRYFTADPKSDVLTNSMLCAGYINEPKDTCQGDSGGPLVKKVGSNWVIIGITSWGFSCAKNMPGVYTDVSHFLSWINSIIKQ